MAGPIFGTCRVKLEFIGPVTQYLILNKTIGFDQKILEMNFHAGGQNIPDHLQSSPLDNVQR
jgi:hypothetical protein